MKLVVDVLLIRWRERGARWQIGWQIDAAWVLKKRVGASAFLAVGVGHDCFAVGLFRVVEDGSRESEARLLLVLLMAGDSVLNGWRR